MKGQLNVSAMKGLLEEWTRIHEPNLTVPSENRSVTWQVSDWRRVNILYEWAEVKVALLSLEHLISHILLQLQFSILCTGFTLIDIN